MGGGGGGGTFDGGERGWGGEGRGGEGEERERGGCPTKKNKNPEVVNREEEEDVPKRA